jgi:transposase InsO family protein
VFFNRQRRHRALGQLSPVQFEELSNIPTIKENSPALAA